MKKATALLLTFVMLFTFAACKGKQCLDHADRDGDGRCELCDKVIEQSKNPLLLASSVLDQLERAGSVKLEVDMTVTSDEVSWSYGYNEATDEYDSEEKYEGYEEVRLHISVVTSRAPDGGSNAKIFAETWESYEKGDEPEYEQMNIYVIDGDAYMLDEASGVYIKDASVTDYLTVTRIAEELGKVDLYSEEEKNELLFNLGDYFMTKFNVIDYRGSVSFDLKDRVSELLNYFSRLDLNSKKVEELLDDLFIEAGLEITTDELVDKLYEIITLTTSEALVELDKWLVEKEGMTLGEIAKNLSQNESFKTFINNSYKIYRGFEPDEILPTEYKNELNSIISTLETFDAEKMLADSGLADVKLYDLIVSFMGIYDAPTPEEFINYVTDVTEYTLSELDDAIGVPMFSSIKQFARDFTLDRLDGEVVVNFKNIFEIDTVEGGVNFAFTYSPESAVYGKYDTTVGTMDVSFKLHEISDETVHIALPHASTVIDKGALGTFEHSWDDSQSMTVSCEGGYADITICCVYDGLYGNENVMLRARDIPLHILTANPYTIPVGSYDVYVDGILVKIDDECDVTVHYRASDKTFETGDIPFYLYVLELHG